MILYSILYFYNIKFLFHFISQSNSTPETLLLPWLQRADQA